MITHYVESNKTEAVDACLADWFDADIVGSEGAPYTAKLVKGNRYEYLAGDACGCGCGGEAVLIAYTDDGAPVALWVCGSLFTPV